MSDELKNKDKDDALEKKYGKVDEKDIEKVMEAAPESDKEENKVVLVDELLEWAESFVFAMFIVILIFTFILRIVVVDGESMENTLSNKDRLILTHINYTPKRGDIVVINSYDETPDTPYDYKGIGKTIIKRVIGVGGDTVVVDYNNDTVTVNGENVDCSYIKEEDMRDAGLFNGKYKTDTDGVYEYEVPDGCYFVMGDNRNNSNDSRAQAGFVTRDEILGKVVFRIFPLSKFGKIS